VAATGCTDPETPAPGPGPAPTCRNPTVIDFAKASVRQTASEATAYRYVLTVTGTKPSISQSVRLFPVVYIQQPDYHLIQVQTCDPEGPVLDVTAPYTVTMSFLGSMGRKGIAVGGTGDHQQRFDLDSGMPGRP
jgi:hypothetical protein